MSARMFIPLGLVPRKCPPTPGIVRADQANFVSIVYAGGAGIGHLEQRGQPIR